MDYCKCLYESENGLPRTQSCFRACDAQHRILAEREKMEKEIKEPTESLIVETKRPSESEILFMRLKQGIETLRDETHQQDKNELANNLLNALHDLEHRQFTIPFSVYDDLISKQISANVVLPTIFQYKGKRTENMYTKGMGDTIQVITAWLQTLNVYTP